MLSGRASERADEGEKEDDEEHDEKCRVEQLADGIDDAVFMN